MSTGYYGVVYPAKIKRRIFTVIGDGDGAENPWKISFRVNIPNGTLNLEIFQTLTNQNANNHPQNSRKKSEHSQCSDFFLLFCHIVQYILYRMRRHQTKHISEKRILGNITFFLSQNKY